MASLLPVMNYPNGFASNVTILGMPIVNTTSHNVFWVDSNRGNDGWKGTFQHPWATVGRATSFTQAGDTVMIADGHAETISTATAFTSSTAGVKYVGLGAGTRRPLFTLDATGSTFNITANGNAFVNCQFVAGVAAVVSAFTLTTATGFALDQCRFYKTSSYYYTYIVDTNATANAADGLTITGCNWTDSSTSVTSFVKCDASQDGVQFHNNYINLGVGNDLSSGFAVVNGSLLTNFFADGNRIRRLNTTTSGGGALVNTDGTTNTGIISRNYVQTAVAGTPLLTLVNSGFAFFENYLSGVADTSGFILPVRDT